MIQAGGGSAWNITDRKLVYSPWQGYFSFSDVGLGADRML